MELEKSMTCENNMWHNNNDYPSCHFVCSYVTVYVHIAPSTTATSNDNI